MLRMALLPLLAAVVACQPSEGVALERSAAGLEQVQVTIESRGSTPSSPKWPGRPRNNRRG
jgi:hypothetical protein